MKLYATALILALAALTGTPAEATDYNLVYIGNSITQGVIIDDPATNAPPVKCTREIAKARPNSVCRYFNGGCSGATTVDFLPGKTDLFDKIIEASDRMAGKGNARFVFSIMLGTNDSAISGPAGAPVSAGDYRRNLSAVVDSLLTRYPGSIAVLHRPVWYSDNTHNGARYLKEGQQRLDVYYAELRSMAREYAERQPGRVFLGDTEGYGYFKQHHKSRMFAENGNSGVFYLHPNLDGGTVLARLWAEAILRHLDNE